MPTFIWISSRDPVNTVKPRVLKAQFGDGYGQRGPDGLNSLLRSFALQFNNRARSEIDAIEAFLIERGGYQSFDWTPPDGAAGKWVCDAQTGWSRTRHNPTTGSLSCTFTEVPA